MVALRWCRAGAERSAVPRGQPTNPLPNGPAPVQPRNARHQPNGPATAGAALTQTDLGDPPGRR
ncbi:hypothetical protein [uncultured Corynebacterium sp.]|uniref:hypothetical protein n=1 Tax=uncultured Corynebacterium sp. TaxID=159447 RepID=UPI0028ECB37A|nr:hypothetical protein [uncultured Corynebacterium sp.]